MPQPLHNQQDLLLRVAKGDEQAFQQFFQEHWPQVYGTSLRLTKDPEKAQDLTQDVFIKIWEQRERLADIRQADGYIYTLARNLVLDFLRKRVFDSENIDYLIHYFKDASLNPQEKLEYRELETLLHQAMDHLPEKIGRVFRLSRVEGLTHEQIAEQLGISIVTSKTYVVRALQAIRKYMAAHGDSRTLVIAGILLKLFMLK